MITALCFDATKNGQVVGRFEISLQKKSRKISDREIGTHFDIRRNGTVVTYCIPFRQKLLEGTTYKTRDFLLMSFFDFISTSLLLILLLNIRIRLFLLLILLFLFLVPLSILSSTSSSSFPSLRCSLLLLHILPFLLPVLTVIIVSSGPERIKGSLNSSGGTDNTKNFRINGSVVEYFNSSQN